MYFIISVRDEMKLQEKRIEEMLVAHQRQMQTYIEEQFFIYKQSLTTLSTSNLCPEAAKVQMDKNELEKQLFAKFSFPLQTLAELKAWDAAIHDAQYNNFMVRITFNYFMI